MSTGRTALLTSEIRPRQQSEQSDSDGEDNEEPIDVDAIDARNDGSDERSSGRKRSATTHDPKKQANTNKRNRRHDEFNAHMRDLVEVFRKPIEVKPIEVVDPGDKWINEAHELWKKDFASVDFEVARAVFEEWNQNTRSAQTFVVSGDDYRKSLVAHHKRNHGVWNDE